MQISGISLVTVGLLLTLAGCGERPAEEVSTPTGSTVASSPASSTAKTAESTTGSGAALATPLPAAETAQAEPAPIAASPAQTAPTADDFPARANRALVMPAGTQRDDAVRDFVRTSMRGEFERTHTWARSLPPGPTRDKAFAVLVEDLAKTAPMLAADLARQIADPATRAAAESKFPTRK